MQFNSIPFLFFCLLFFPIWHLVKSKHGSLKHVVLVFFSFIFYGWWDWRFLFLIIFSGLVDYATSLLIVRNPQKSKRYFVISLIVNIGSLSIFKYSSFFAQTLSGLFSFLGIQIDLQANIPEFALILPVGISFYTFQSMSYTIDVYRKRLSPTRNVFLFFSYLSMFPQLVAGPIVRAKHVLGQLDRPKKISPEMLWNSIKIVLIGLFQKVVLADNIAYFVNTAFGTLHFQSGGVLYWWAVMIGFSLQIYFDFSGYSLIARGLAKMMGLHFRMNFNHPYLATSLKEFWSRWHISLSTWFRDYIYIPLGGSRKGSFFGIVNLWIVMLLSGLWHGAAFNFVLWGAVHAFFQTAERFYLKKIESGFKIIMRILVLMQVVSAWVFFRADSFADALAILGEMYMGSLGEFNQPELRKGLVFVVFALLIELGYHLSLSYPGVRNFFKKQTLQLIYMLVMFMSILLLRGPEQGFIYFQF